jgi:hypothetical protein
MLARFVLVMTDLVWWRKGFRWWFCFSRWCDGGWRCRGGGWWFLACCLLLVGLVLAELSAYFGSGGGFDSVVR